MFLPVECCRAGDQNLNIITDAPSVCWFLHSECDVILDYNKITYINIHIDSNLRVLLAEEK